MSYIDAVSRVGQLQDQIASLQTAFTPSSATTTTTPSTGGAALGAGSQSIASASSTSPASFQSALSGAMGTDVSLTTPSTTTALPTQASTMLTSDQQQFASRLAADTGLDPGVVSAWLLAEESGGAAVARQSANNNDWLNIGYTGSGTFGNSDAIWGNPVSAADATAGWLKGQNTIPGYGTASSGIQAVLRTAGEPASSQISALQGSGWAASGYPELASLYQQVAG